MSEQLTINPKLDFDPKLDFAIERFIDAPARLVWEALTKPEHLKEWYMPRAWGRVAHAEMDVRPGGGEQRQAWRTPLVTDSLFR